MRPGGRGGRQGLQGRFRGQGWGLAGSRAEPGRAGQGRGSCAHARPAAHAPHGVPALGVVVGDGEAQLGVDREAAGGREEADRGRLEGVLRWEDQLAVVDAAGVLGIRGALQNEVPLQQVVGQRVRRDVRHGLLRGVRGMRRIGRCRPPSSPRPRRRWTRPIEARGRRGTVCHGASSGSRRAPAGGRQLPALAFRSVRYSFWSRFMHCLLVAMLACCGAARPPRAPQGQATEPGAGGLCCWFLLERPQSGTAQPSGRRGVCSMRSGRGLACVVCRAMVTCAASLAIHSMLPGLPWHLGTGPGGQAAAVANTTVAKCEHSRGEERRGRTHQSPQARLCPAAAFPPGRRRQQRRELAQHLG